MVSSIFFDVPFYACKDNWLVIKERLSIVNQAEIYYVKAERIRANT